MSIAESYLIPYAIVTAATAIETSVQNTYIKTVSKVVSYALIAFVGAVFITSTFASWEMMIPTFCATAVITLSLPILTAGLISLAEKTQCKELKAGLIIADKMLSALFKVTSCFIVIPPFIAAFTSANPLLFGIYSVFLFTNIICLDRYCIKLYQTKITAQIA